MKITYLLLALPLLTFFSCEDDSAQTAAQNQLVGRWELVEAYRNNQLTPSLENLYFEFTETDSMRTNLNNGRTETVPYEVKEEQIVPEGSSLEAIYQIVSLTDSSLELSTNIGRFPFRFILRKVLTEDIEM